MILIDTKVDGFTSASKIDLPLLDVETTTISFSDLLNSIKTKTSATKEQAVVLINTDNKELKDISSKPQILNKDAQEQKQNFINSFLNIKNLEKNSTGMDILDKDMSVLNPKIIQEIDTKEIKLLITNSKEYLKNKILSSDDYKKATVKELPKTLSGLKKLAKVYNLDVSKITLEDIRGKSTNIKSLKVDTQKVQPVQKELNKDTQQQISEAKNKVFLFKEPLDTMKVQHTTEQLVQIKQQKPYTQEHKQKKENTLNSLISGKKILKQETVMEIKSGVIPRIITPDISTTTKVQSNTIGLEAILKENINDAKDDTIESNITTTSIHKVDSLEVKLNEAKQMIRYISQDIKNSIDEYKSPFTRVKLQLNPKNMGEVDLTVVQRGKNLHINLSSNNVAINTLSQNINELRVQLNNNGINNATLNFSSNSQGSDQSSFGQQQQHSHNGNRAKDEYDYFEQREKSSEEIINSLEIIVPHYA